LKRVLVLVFGVFAYLCFVAVALAAVMTNLMTRYAGRLKPCK